MAYIKLFKELWHCAGNDCWKVVLFIILHALAQLATLMQSLCFCADFEQFSESARPDFRGNHDVAWGAANYSHLK